VLLLLFTPHAAKVTPPVEQPVFNGGLPPYATRRRRRDLSDTDEDLFLAVLGPTEDLVT